MCSAISPSCRRSSGGNDEYLLQQNQLGLTHERSTAAGVEVAYATPHVQPGSGRVLTVDGWNYPNYNVRLLGAAVAWAW